MILPIINSYIYIGQDSATNTKFASTNIKKDEAGTLYRYTNSTNWTCKIEETKRVGTPM